MIEFSNRPTASSLLYLGASLLAFLLGCSSSSESADSQDSSTASTKPISLLNVSYDPTREFYQEFNESFAKHWLEQHQQRVTIEQSHGGAGKQARAVMDGLEADVVTLAIGYDIDVMAQRTRLLDTNWQSRLPHNSSPYTSTIVFLVRKGNPKGIKDWDDLIRGDVSIITTNPKTSGGARWNYLSAWTYALHQELGDLSQLSTVPAEDLAAAESKARDFVAQIYQRVPVLDSGARGATNTFLQRKLGDVLITWENEAFMALKESADGSAEIVVPSISLLTEPPVAVVDKYVQKHGTTHVAQAYLRHLYSSQGQQLAAKYFFRPTSTEGISVELLSQFPELKLETISNVFGNWQAAQRTHFDDGGLFDQIYQPTAK
ncbi:MAG: sulfate ABC transporter substrate-binding protein [Pirellulaceae bacterium]|nr:sulfate ABC transporter substrate-binding protein [Pirellulaceae bacterium]